MLEIIVPSTEFFDETTAMFISSGPDTTLQLEHSLVSLSKWESNWEKPFLSKEKKTTEETISYIKAMCLTPNISSEVFDRLTEGNLKDVNDYIASKMSATWFVELPERPGSNNRDIITAEIIYYWLVALTIPISCETWHLNRLFTLIKVTNEKNNPKKAGPKVGRNTMAAQRRALNESRLKEYNTTG